MKKTITHLTKKMQDKYTERNRKPSDRSSTESASEIMENFNEQKVKFKKQPRYEYSRQTHLAFDGIDHKNLSQREWEKLPENKKLELLQQIENNISTIQNRNVRKIIYEAWKKKGIIGEYIFDDPDNIHLYNINNATKTIETIIHEGTHALIDDAVLGKKDKIFLVSKIDSETLSAIVSGRDIIYNHFSHLGNKSIEFNLLYYEEQLARYESYIHLINWIISITDESDQIKNELINNVLLSAVNYYIYCYEIEKQFGKYNDETTNIDFNKFKNKFRLNEIFEITNINMEPIEQYFKNCMNQILKTNGFNEMSSFSPYYLPNMIDNINKAKQKNELDSYTWRETNIQQNISNINLSPEEEYEQLSSETKYIINEIIYYKSHADQIQNIAIKNVIYPEFEDEIERLGPNSKLYKYFHCDSKSGWAGFNIVENVKKAMKWKVEDPKLYQRIIDYYEYKKEEIEKFSNDIAIILSLYKFSPELRQRFREWGIEDLIEFLGIKEHTLIYGDVPNRYKKIKEELWITTNKPSKITPTEIAIHFLKSNKTLQDLIYYIKSQNLTHNILIK